MGYPLIAKIGLYYLRRMVENVFLVGGLEELGTSFHSVRNFSIPIGSYFAEGCLNHQPDKNDKLMWVKQ